MKACKAATPPRYAARYSALSAKTAAKKTKNKNKRIKEQINDFVETRAEGAAALAIHKNEEYPLQVNNAPSITSFVTGTPSTVTKSSPLSSSQPSINTAFSRNYQQDVRDANKVVFDMAVADFFHCNIIPDSVVESPRFARLLKIAKLVPSPELKLPSRKKLSGELLNINFENCQKANKELVLKQALLFGLAIGGYLVADGATVKRMPLLNVFVM